MQVVIPTVPESASASNAWFRFARAVGTSLAFVALFPAVWHVRTLVATLRARFDYPMDIEWMEGGHIYHAYRIVHGLYVYGDPTRGFATFPYPPIYWLGIAAAGSAFRLDYATGRLVSIVCLVATAAILVGAVARNAPSRGLAFAFAVIAVTGIAAGYPSTGGSYDLARPDSMALFFPVLAAALAGDGRLGTTRALLVALALTATMYTKQTGVFFAVWLIAFAFIRHRRGGVILALTTLAMSGALLIVLSVVTDGWFFVWLFDQAKHPSRFGHWKDAVALFLAHAPFVVPWLVLLPSLFAALCRRKWLRPETAKWAGMLVAALVASLVPYLKLGGWLNVLIPAVVVVWPVGLLLLGDLARGLWPRGVRARAAIWGAVAASGIVFWFLKYDPAEFVPSAERWRDAKALNALVGDLEGSVVVTTSPFVAIRNGKTNEQPIFQAYLDAETAGIHVDYIDALHRSGTRYVFLTGRHAERELDLLVEPTFARTRDCDFRVQSLASWDHPESLSLWRRREAK